MGNPDVYAAIEIAAKSCAGVAWGVERKVRGGSWERLDSHPLLDLFERPRPGQANTGFVGGLVRWLLIGGEFFVARPELPAVGPPRELWTLQNHRVKIKPSNNPVAPIERYEYKVGGSEKYLKAEHVLHVPLFNPLDDFYGLSPLAAAAKLVDQADGAAEYNLGLLQNGGIPPGFLKTDDELGPDQFANLKKEMHDNWTASKNAGLPQLLEGGMSWQDAARSAKDMQMLEAQRMHALKFAQVVGIPSEFLSGAGEKKYANYPEARKALYMEFTCPTLDLLADAFNQWLAPMFSDDVRLVYIKDDIEALQEDREKVWARVNAAQHLTVNEKRALTGQDEIPGGDVILVPFSLQPLSVATAEPEAAPPAPEESQTKALNVPDAEKAAYWKLVDSRRRRLEQSVAALAEKRLKADNTAILKAMQGAPTEPAMIGRMEKAVDAQAAAWQKWLEDVYVKVGEPFAEETLGQLKASAGPSRVKAAEGAWVARVMAYLKSNGAAKVKDIGESTKNSLRAVIEKGVADGLSIPKIAELVSEHNLAAIIPNRARTIARTETVAASNAASLAAAESTELPLAKEWISTADDRTRDSHQSVETVAMDEPFVLDSGSELDFPGDWSNGADAGDIVNCRCTQAYTVVDG